MVAIWCFSNHFLIRSSFVQTDVVRLNVVVLASVLLRIMIELGTRFRDVHLFTLSNSVPSFHAEGIVRTRSISWISQLEFQVVESGIAVILVVDLRAVSESMIDRINGVCVA